MRTYWKALLVLVAMALVMAVDGVALVAVLLTFGLAFPLVFAATGALALLCLYPAVRGWKDNRVRGVLLSAALAAIVFAGPAIVGDWQARRLVAVATSADVAPPAMPENPGSLEIRRPSSGHDGLFEGSGACGSECRALLRSGRVDWVRVVMLDMRGKPLDEQPVRVRLGRGDDCAAPGFAADGGDTCILQSADDGAPAGLVLSFETGSGKRVEGLTDRGFAGPRRIWRVTARRPGDAAPVLRRTAVEIRRPAMPAIVGPEFNGMNSEGIRFQQTARRHGDVSLSATLAALGLAVNPAAIAEERTAAVRTRGEPPSAATTRSMVAVLDLPQAAPFSRDQARPVAQWVMQARAIRDWTPERTALFRRVLRDRRIQSPTFADQIFARNPDLARQMLPDLLEVLETDDGEAVYTQARRIAYSLADIDPALLAPHATRLAALAMAGDQPVDETPGRRRVLPPEEVAAFLSTLPLAILPGRLPGPEAEDRRMLESMRRLGLRTLGDLAALPVDAVADRFGPSGLAARDLALGIEGPIRPRTPFEQMTERLDLPDAASGIHLEGGLTILCDRLATRLRAAGASVRALSVEARLLGGGSWSHQASPRQPTASSPLLRMLLLPALEQLPRPADRLGLRVLETAPESADQLEVIHRPGETRRRRLGEAARQVRAAVGESALMRILETEPESRLPERRMLLTPYSSE